MGHPNADRLQSFLEAYAAKDAEGVGRALADDAVWHVGGTHQLSGDYRGREAILGYFDRVGEETGGTLRLEPRHLDVTMAEAFQFDGDGRIREFWAHATDQDAIDRFWA